MASASFKGDLNGLFGLKDRPMSKDAKKRNGKIAMLPITSIRIDGGTQIRESVNPQTVEDYAADLKAGAKFPPGIVYFDGAAYWLADGFQRLNAHCAARRKMMRFEIRQGGQREAILYAVGANATHGARRTNADKRRAVQTLLSDAEWSKLSDRKVASLCGVSQPFVSSERRSKGDNGYHLATRNGKAFTLAAAPCGGIDTAPLKWHGGKQPLARRIIGLMPAHATYVETHAGALGVLLAKQPEGVSEIVNDIDADLVNFWNVLRGEETFAKLVRISQATPFCEATWKECGREMKSRDPIRRAWAFFVRCRQSLAGRMKGFSPLSVNRTRRGMNEQASSWLSAIEGLPEVHARLARVAILNRDGAEVVRQHDSPTTLFYVDPTYTPDSRSSPEVYRHEMTPAQHRTLIKTLLAAEGKVILSGYANPLYDRALSKWERIEIERSNSAAGGERKRVMTEVLWLNFTPMDRGAGLDAQG